MTVDYKDRGIFHKVTNHTHFKTDKCRFKIVRYPSKFLLKTETGALFAKDIVTNKLRGKEFHVRLTRQQNKSGSYHTHISLVRADAPAYKQRGILHRISNLDRRIEGDVKHSAKPKGKLRRFSSAAVKKTALSSETVALTLSSVAYNHLRQNLRNNADGMDSGKAALAALSSVGLLNQARKGAIRHRLQKAAYKQQKLSLKQYKPKLKLEKSKFKQEKKNIKLKSKSKKRQLKRIRSVFGKADVNNYNWTKMRKYKRTKKKLKANKKCLKKLKKTNKKLYKNAKKVRKNKRKLKKLYKTKPLILLSAKAVTAKAGGRYFENIVKNNTDNDFLSAASKGKDVIRDAKTVNRYIKNFRVSRAEKKPQKLNKKKSKLQNRKTKLSQKSKAKKVKKPKPKPKLQDKVKKAAIDFVKFIFKFLGALAAPLIIVILVFAIILMMFGGFTQKSSYVVGTFNCTDYTMTRAIDKYTELANDFNQKVMKCQSSSTWKNGLNSFGVNTDDMDDTPTQFIFGRNTYQNYDPVYDFDSSKLIAFMCAYTYDFNTDNEDVKFWEYQSGYNDVIKKLFNKEYKFESKYVNTSHWVTCNNYSIYPGKTSFWKCNGSGIVTVNSKKYGYVEFNSVGIPSELQPYSYDRDIHFDLNTGEVKNINNKYKKTGYYIQNLDYQYTSPSGDVLPSFYKNVYNPNTNEHYKGFNINDTWYHKTQLYSYGQKYDYAMSYKDAQKFTGDVDFHFCLVRDFKAEEYIKECKLYTNVKQQMTFEQAIKSILQEQNHFSDRWSYYNTLVNQEPKTYGLHQNFNSPLPSNFSTLTSQGKIYNSFGYDMQKWNSKHCSLNYHDGMDIKASSGTNVYSMIDGKVESINTSTHTVTITTSTPINYWYENSNHRTKIVYKNITPKSTLHTGDTVKSGDIIGKVDNYRHCEFNNLSNTGANTSYLHITVKIQYGQYSNNWYCVDPAFLIKRE